MSQRQLRWVAVSVLFVSSALNYLDRMILSALMPTLRQEFSLSGTDLGNLVAAFSIAYALASPVMGILIDRAGLRLGASLVVGLWSAVGMMTGLTSSFAGLMLCRAFLGFAESGGIPAAGKGSAVYLEPRDRALGSAVSQIGLTLGSVAAPVITGLVSARFGWRSTFVVTGLLGFVWIPFWLFASSRAAPAPLDRDESGERSWTTILADRRYRALILANVLSMTVYSLWTTWITWFLVTAYRLKELDANLRYAWIPPIFQAAGGLLGGVVAQRLIQRGPSPVRQRLRISLVASVFVIVTAMAPIAGSPALATACVCLSLMAVTAQSVNYYSIPLDLFGGARAAFAVSVLTSVFGLMQFFLAPAIGTWSESIGWQPICSVIAVLPLLSALLLRFAFRES